MPEGFLYSLLGVSVPNYTFEIMIWIGFNMAFFSLAGVLFLIAGAYQMTIWAIGKHRRYRKMFGDDYPKRKAIIPFIL